MGSSGESTRLLLSLAEVQEKKCSGSGKIERSCSVIHLVNILAYLLLYYDFHLEKKKGNTCKAVWLFYVCNFLFCGELKDRVGLPLNPTVFSFQCPGKILEMTETNFPLKKRWNTNWMES